MNLNFDTENVEVTEFGLGRHFDKKREFAFVPTDRKVQSTLQDMVKATYQKVTKDGMKPPTTFDPADKHGSIEYLTLPIDNDLAVNVKTLHQASNLSPADNPLDWITKSFCYFAQFHDQQRRRLTAIRRATQFKGALKKQNRILSLGNDALRIVEDPIFQLNTDFDVIIDSNLVHIIHPISFRLLGQIDEAIAEAVPHNIQTIKNKIGYVDWSTIEEYASTHSRAANLLASIRTDGHANNLNKEALLDLCARTGVKLGNSGSDIRVPEDQVIGFLEVLDRRRYELNLVTNGSEQFRASSRQRLGG